MVNLQVNKIIDAACEKVLKTSIDRYIICAGYPEKCKSIHEVRILRHLKKLIHGIFLEIHKFRYFFTSAGWFWRATADSIEKQLQREYIRTNRYYCASGKTKDNPGSNAAQLIYPSRTLYSLDCKHRLAKRISIGNYFDCTHDPDSYRTKPCFIIFEDKGKPLLKAVR